MRTDTQFLAGFYDGDEAREFARGCRALAQEGGHIHAAPRDAGSRFLELYQDIQQAAQHLDGQGAAALRSNPTARPQL